MRRLIIDTAARADMATAAIFYESEQPGLGKAFTDDLDKAITRIINSPLHFPVLKRNIRRARLKRFPYGIYFIIEEDAIVVIACLHSSRSPAVWAERV